MFKNTVEEITIAVIAPKTRVSTGCHQREKMSSNHGWIECRCRRWRCRCWYLRCTGGFGCQWWCGALNFTGNRLISLGFHTECMSSIAGSYGYIAPGIIM
ncbi:hypothetical protein HanHA300_Chr16g0615921 [Helianthus annuus]|nr:hypothetical protein HanHA300_Chr16g0615921 [Helianthus annuus]KAJ0460951.1 hypothetical protein HanHA89_Chr16g0666761 [Helianthus annuus]KAJ0641377.1 hypothetical protein HanLR1_Chr16g0626491 [Helianthus annuus]KAJ0645274.1 hypothetical protein HanOQP8_Chr16g0622021 [Helianthus annuus]